MVWVRTVCTPDHVCVLVDRSVRSPSPLSQQSLLSQNSPLTCRFSRSPVMLEVRQCTGIFNGGPLRPRLAGPLLNINLCYSFRLAQR